jgi:hypothetical protein
MTAYVVVTVCFDTVTQTVLSSQIDGVFATEDEAEAAFPPETTSTVVDGHLVSCTRAIHEHPVGDGCQ